MVYSASSYITMSNHQPFDFYLLRQVGFLVLGLVFAVAITFIYYGFFTKRYVLLPLLALLLVGLVYTQVAGNSSYGAQRWADISGLNFQASEFVKIVVLLVMARELTRFYLHGSYSRITCAIILSVLMVFVLLEKDLGTTALCLVMVLIMLWLSGIRLRWIALIIAAVALLVVTMIAFEPYRISRVATWFNPYSDPQGSGYQIINSWYAFANGGLFGRGIGNSTQKALYLTQAQNDFIFAIIGEETGVVGVLAVVLLFFGLVWSGLRIALACPDFKGKLIAGGASTIIGVQAFLNIFCTLGILPVTGKTLPFISYGGSSMLAIMMLCGLVLSVARHSDPETIRKHGRDDLILDVNEALYSGDENLAGKGGLRSRPSFSAIFAEQAQDLVQSKLGRPGRDTSQAGSKAGKSPNKGKDHSSQAPRQTPYANKGNSRVRSIHLVDPHQKPK
jgi:cell division protein FtsW